MPLGFLEGLAGGFGDAAREARERNRQEAEVEWLRREKFLTGLAKGEYGEVSPDLLHGAMQDLAEMASQGGPKRKKGVKAKITGAQQLPTSSVLEMLMSGDSPLYDAYENTDAGGEAQARATQERAAPTASEAIQSTPISGRGLPPPPGGAQPIPGGAEGMQRYQVQPPGMVPQMQIEPPVQQAPAPPRPNAARGALAQAAGTGFAQLQQSGPMQPSRTPGMFKSPEQQAEEQRQAALRNAQGMSDVYESFDPKYSDSLRRSMMDIDQAPGGAEGTRRWMTFVNPEDTQERVTVQYGQDGTTYTTQGQPVQVPRTWIEDSSASTGGAAPAYHFGEGGMIRADRYGPGMQVEPYPINPATGQPFAPIGARNAPIEARAPAEQVDPARHYDSQQWQNAQAWQRDLDTSPFGPYGNPNTGQQQLRQDMDEYARSIQVPPGMGEPYQDWADLQSRGSMYTKTPVLPPPPREEQPYPGTPGINPGPGAPGAEQTGWVGAGTPPSMEQFESASPEQLISWYFNNTDVGRGTLGRLGGGSDAANEMAAAALEDPEYLGLIRSRIANLLRAIYGARP